MHALFACFLSLLLVAPTASGWLGVYLSTDVEQAVVSEVIPGTPAAKAGLKSGDAFLAVGDTLTPSRDKFVAAVQKHEVGARVKIKIRRLKQELVVYVQLGQRPDSSGAGTAEVVDESAATVARRSARKPVPLPSTPIAEVAPQATESAANREKGYLGIAVGQGDGGMRIDRVLASGPGDKGGLRSGDVLQSIGDHRIRTLEDLDRVLMKVSPGRKVSVRVVRGDLQKSLIVKFGRRSVDDSKSGGVAVARPVDQAKAVRGDEQSNSQELGRPVRESRQSAPNSVPSGSQQAGLTNKSLGKGGFEQDLRALRKELQDLRRMLAEIRRSKNGGE